MPSATSYSDVMRPVIFREADAIPPGNSCASHRRSLVPMNAASTSSLSLPHAAVRSQRRAASRSRRRLGADLDRRAGVASPLPASASPCSKLRDPALAEDAVHDVIEAVLSGRAGFGGRAALRSWLTAVLKNKIVDTCAATCHHDALDDDEGGEGAGDTASPASSRAPTRSPSSARSSPASSPASIGCRRRCATRCDCASSRTARPSRCAPSSASARRTCSFASTAPESSCSPERRPRADAARRDRALRSSPPDRCPRSRSASPCAAAGARFEPGFRPSRSRSASHSARGISTST